MPEQSPLNRSLQSSNPQSVLNSIGAGQGTFGPVAVGPSQQTRTYVEAPPTLKIVRASELEAADEQVEAQQVEVEPAEVEQVGQRTGQANAETTSRFSGDVADQTNDDILMSTIESAKQIQQLAMRLEQFQSELVERERDLEVQNRQWQVAVQQSEVEFDRRVGQLQQQTAQTRLQQRHVMQLQSDVVQSYEAAKIAIEGIVISDADLTLHANMQALKQELGSRFDYVARRWEHLHGLLEIQRAQLDAAQSIDDCNEWTK